MWTTSDVVAALERDGYRATRRGCDRWLLRHRDPERVTELAMDDESIAAFVSANLADGAALWPGVPPECGAYNLLLANLFEAVELSPEVTFLRGELAWPRRFERSAIEVEPSEDLAWVADPRRCGERGE